MRLFVAVVPPPEAREAALHDMGALPWRGDIRWLPPENLHLTLKFLGETPETELAGLRDATRDTCENHPAFDLTLRGCGAFPCLDSARVLWVGVDGGSESLRDLTGHIESAVECLGVERDGRPFHPHLTVGKSKGDGVRLEEPGQRAEMSPIHFRVGSVELVQSRLSQDGAAYSTVGSYPLGVRA